MIDLHAHSTHSDGSLTPAGLVDYAVRQGLTALALTDHDITSGLSEAAARADAAGVRFIPGVELEINSEKGEFHLLGLNLRGDLRPLERALIEVRDHRAQRNERIVQKMRESGLSVTLDDIKAYGQRGVISRLHFALYLVAQGTAASVHDAFDRFLDRGRPFYDPKKALDLREAVELIHGAGGKAVIAHPFSLELDWESLTAFLLEGKNQGLDGMEAFHTDYPLPDCRRLAEFGRAHGLIITAGSDFHGAHVPRRKLGLSAGGMSIGPEFLSWLPASAY